MRTIIRKMLKDWGEFRVNQSGQAFYTFKAGTPNHIKSIYKGYRKSKQQELPL